MNGLGRKNYNNNSKEPSILTPETLGVVLILFATLCLVCLITRGAVFSLPGQWVNFFLFGCFGKFAYLVLLWAIIEGVVLIAGKKVGFSVKKKVLLTLSFVILAILSHIISMTGFDGGYGDYLAKSYLMAENGGLTASAGGVIVGIVAFGFSELLTDVGSYVVLGICLIVSVFFLVRDFLYNRDNAEKIRGSFRSSFVKEEQEKQKDVDLDVKVEGVRDYPNLGVDVNASLPTDNAKTGKQRLFINNPNDFAFLSKREIAKDEGAKLKVDVTGNGLGVVSQEKVTEFKVNELTSSDYKSKLDYIKTPPVIDLEKINSKSYSNTYSYNSESAISPDGNTTISDYINKREENAIEPDNIPHLEHDGGRIDADDAKYRAEMFGNRYADIVEVESVAEEEEPIEEFREVDFTQNQVDDSFDILQTESASPFIDQTESSVEIEEEIEENAISEQPKQSEILGSDRVRNILFGKEEDTKEVAEAVKDASNGDGVGFTSRVSADDNLGARRRISFEQPIEQPAQPKEEENPQKPKPPINRKYFRPPLDLLETYRLSVDAPQENHQERMAIIERTLEEFKIKVTPQGYVQGPSITRYEVTMPAGIPISKVLSCADNLQMRLAVREGVRIEAPIPGKDMVGIEVANKSRTTVGLKELLEGMAKNSSNGGLVFAVGKDVVGNVISDDLAKGPHYLIAGATGSGKSICLHVILCSLLMRYSPEELKIVLVDPKQSEFIKYEHLPHLLIDEIISDSKRAITLLQWAYEETTRRNEMFAETGGMVSNIDEYNSQIASDTVPKLPRIVFFIDELADLMESQKREMEEKIRRIAAKSRSAGIHLVLATQRPSVDVITGTIKNNLPSRIALKLMGFNDSQTIINRGGAEKLLGNGDMLYQNSKMSDPERYQGAYIANREIMNIVNYIKENNKAYFDDGVSEYLENNTKEHKEDFSQNDDSGDNGSEENNELFLQALRLAVTTQTISISQLQRRFQIGWARAGSLIDKMESLGYISPNEGSKARRVFLTKEGYEEKYGKSPDAF